jgi:beta-glucosidase/6-phospho-beta-glucosidase/beta-galactosidase
MRDAAAAADHWREVPISPARPRSARSGIVHVDYDTQARTPKDSAAWYADVIAANAVPID